MDWLDRETDRYLAETSQDHSQKLETEEYDDGMEQY